MKTLFTCSIPTCKPAVLLRLMAAMLLLLIYIKPAHSQGIIPTKGTDFWMACPYMHDFAPASKQYNVFVTSDVSTTGTVYIPLQGWSQAFTVTANQTTTLTLPLNLVEHLTSGSPANRGIHILTADTVSVFAITFQDYTSDATVVFPRQTLGTKYRVGSYPGLDASYPSFILIVATEDNTQIQITPTANTVNGQAAGVPFTINLNEGQSYQMQANTAAGDFTGTLLEGTGASGPCRPFSVFSGTTCVNIPNGCGACDILYEQSLPTSAWGSSFYMAPFSFATSYTFRVLADQNGTTYTVNGGPPATLNAGQFVEVNNVTGPRVVQSNKPINLIQYMEGVSCAGAGDPSMVYINPEEQKMDNVTFSTVTSTVITQHVVNVVMKTAHVSQLTLDGLPVPPAQFNIFPTAPTYSYAALTLTQGSHTLDADSGFTAIVYGTGQAESYAYSVGSYSKVQPPPVDSVLCTNSTVTIGSVSTLFSPWWSTATAPNDTIGTSLTLTLNPPIVPDIYQLHGNEFISGCERVFLYAVEVPNPPLVSITQSYDTVCQYEEVQLQANTIPASSIYQFVWTPAAGLNNPNIANPVATPAVNTMYTVAVSSPSGCGGVVYDSTLVYVLPGSVARFQASTTDNLICVGESTNLNIKVEKPVFEDFFDPSPNAAIWSVISGGTGSNACGSLLGNALYFNAAGVRSAATNNLNTTAGGTIAFAIKIANGTAPCDNADFGEDVVLEYSNNNGTTWTLISTYYERMYPNFTAISVPIPAAAQTAATRFRWRQLANSGLGQDNWALDNVLISVVNNNNITVNWTPTAGLSNPNISNPVATPLVTTAYVAHGFDTITGCTYEDTVVINVGQNFTINNMPDTNLCVASGLQLYATPTPGSGFTYRWAPGATLSDTLGATPLATPTSTTTYFVTVTSPFGCEKRDTITVNVSALGSFEVEPDTISHCTGQSTQVQAILQAGCSLSSSLCATPDSCLITLGSALNNSTSSYTPFSAASTSSKRQYLYTAADLNAAGFTAGKISALAFNVSTLGTVQYNNFSIRLGCTNLTALTNTYTNGLATVFNPATVTLTTGWNNFNFNNAYNWDGTSNILIEICYSNTVAGTNSGVFYHNTPTATTIYSTGAVNQCGNLTGTIVARRPNIKLKYCPQSLGAVSYVWSPPVGVSNTAISNPVLTPPANMVYRVVATDIQTGCIFRDSVIARVGAPFTINMPNDTFLCSVSGVPLSMTHTAGPGATIRWTPGESVSDSTIAAPVSLATVSTTYTATVTSAAGCVQNDSVTVSVYGQAIFEVIPDSAAICQGDTIHTNAVRYSSCGTGGNVCASTDSFTVGTDITTSNGPAFTPYVSSSSSSRRQYLITVNELNALGISGSQTITQLAFNITALGAVTTFQNFTVKMGCTSSFALGNTFVTGLSTVKNPGPVTLTTGWNNYVFNTTYDWDGVSNLVVEICYDNAGSTGLSSTVAYTATAFSSSLYTTGSTSMCATTTGIGAFRRPNMRFKYCATPVTNLTYAWTPVQGVSNPAIANPVLQPNATTTYWVVATDTASGCVYSDSLRVRVGAPFVINMPNDTFLCTVSGVPLNMSNTAGPGATIAWTPGESVSDSTIAAPVSLATVSTTYTATVTSAAGCTQTDTVRVNVYGQATFDVTPDVSSLCSGDTVRANSQRINGCGTSGAVCATTSSFDIGTNTTTSSIASYTPFSGASVSGRRQYIITAAELNALGITGGKTITQLALNVSTLGSITTYQNFSIKMGCTSSFTATNTFIPGLLTVRNPGSITLTPGWNNFIFNTTYDWDGVSNLVVELCYDNGSATGTNTGIVFTATAFTSSTYINNNTPQCNAVTGSVAARRPNMRFNYCATPADNLVYAWTPTQGISNPAIPNPVVQPTATTTYMVVATDTVTGCVYSDTMRVNVGPLFTVNAPDTNTCVLGGISLPMAHGAGPGATFEWSPVASLSNPSLANPVASPATTTQYFVTVTSAQGCSVTDSLTLTIGGFNSFSVTPDTASICAGQSVQANVYLSTACGPQGSACTNTDSITIGTSNLTSNSTAYTPFSAASTSARRQYLFTAAELNTMGMTQAGTISSLAFNLLSVSTTTAYSGFTIKMGCTNASVLTSTFVTGLSTVFNPANITIAAGWNTFVFNNTFNWDGISNIIVEVCYQNTTTGNSSTIVYSNTTFNSSIYSLGSAQCNALNGTVATRRPNTRFNYCNTPATNVTYNWQPAAGVSNTTINNPVLSPLTSTVYRLTVTNTAGCVFTDTIGITVGSTSFTANAGADTSVCNAVGVQLNATHTSGNGVMYSWQPANRLNNATVANPVITVNGTQPYIVTVTDSAGCSLSRDTVLVTVLTPAPITVSNDTAICPGSSAQLQASGSAGYAWAPAGTLSNANIANPVATPASPTTYSVTATDVNGCTVTDTVRVNFLSPGNISLGNDTAFCVGGSKVLSPGAGYLAYLWQNGSTAPALTATSSGLYWVQVTTLCGTLRDSIVITVNTPPAVNLGSDLNPCTGTTVTLDAGYPAFGHLWSTGSTNQTISPATGGNYWVAVTDNNGCTGRDTVTVTFRTAPVVNLGNDTTLCSNATLNLNAGNAGATYLWNDNSTAQTLTVTTAGTYWVQVTNSFNCTSTDTIVVNYLAPLSVNLGNDTTLCVGSTLTLNAGGSGINYLWSNAQTTQSIQVTQSGNYWVRVSYNGLCPAADTIQATFQPAPVVNLGNDTTLCGNTTLNLNAGNAGATYLWNDNSTAQTLTVTTASTYWVQVTNSFNCTSTDTIVVNYLPALSVNLGNDTALCAGNTVVLDAGGSGINYLWSNAQTTQSIQVTQSGSYWVRVSYNGLCPAYDTAQVTFNPLPVANLGNDTAICIGNTVVLDAGNAGSTYVWNDNSTAQTLTVNTAGIYSVTVTNAFNCTNADSITLTVNPLPVVAIGADTTVCAQQVVVLNAGNAGATYSWSSGQTTQSITASTTGNYSVTVTDGNTCSAADTANVTVNAPVPLSITPNTTICDWDSIQLTATAPTATTFVWQPAASLSATNTASVWADPASTTTYTVVVTDNFNCTATDTVTITVTNSPVVNLGSDVSFCQGESVTFSAGAGFATYLWQDGSNGTNLTATQQGIYWVEVSNTCGVYRDSVEVLQVHPLPVINLGPGGMVCDNPPYTLNAGNPGSTYLWNTGANTQTILPAQSGAYGVTVTTIFNCVDSASTTIELVSSPNIDLGNDTSICENTEIVLTATWQYSSYQWQDGTTTPTYTVNQPGLYYVMVANLCGSDEDSITVEEEMCDCRVFIPNGFTPNGDNVNDVFKPETDCDMRSFDLKIFNRWGEMVFRSFDPNQGWDGTYKGEMLSPTVLVYTVEYSAIENTKPMSRKLTGSITLIR